MNRTTKKYNEMTNEELQSFLDNTKAVVTKVNVDTMIILYEEIEKATAEKISRISNFQEAIDAFNSNDLTITQLDKYREKFAE